MTAHREDVPHDTHRTRSSSPRASETEGSRSRISPRLHVDLLAHATGMPGLSHDAARLY
jgi:hypothetical protein